MHYSTDNYIYMYIAITTLVWADQDDKACKCLGYTCTSQEHWEFY